MEVKYFKTSTHHLIRSSIYRFTTVFNNEMPIHITSIMWMKLLLSIKFFNFYIAMAWALRKLWIKMCSRIDGIQIYFVVGRHQLRKWIRKCSRFVCTYNNILQLKCHWSAKINAYGCVESYTSFAIVKFSKNDCFDYFKRILFRLCIIILAVPRNNWFVLKFTHFSWAYI